MWLTVLGGPDAGMSVEVSAASFTIGRDEGCELVLKDEEVSRRHATVTLQPDGSAEIADLGSSNGTRVGGSLITAPTALTGGETIRLGNTDISVAAQRPAASTVVRGAAPPPPPRPPAPVEAENGPRRFAGLSVPVAATVAVVAVAAVAVAALFAGGAFDGDGDSSVPDVVANARPSVVVVNASNADGGGGTGSGWVLDAAAGLIVTNNHVINAGSLYSVSVRSKDGGTAGEEDAPLEERSAEIVGTAPCEDLAVLKTDPTGLRTLPLGNQDALRQGDRVTALGFPGTESERANYVQTSGTVSDVRTSFSDSRQLRFDVPDLTDLVLTDTPFNPGNSGGPLVNDKGQLVGVVIGTSPRTQAQNFAIGVERVATVVDELRRGTSMGWIGLGLEFDPGLSGAIVTNVVPGTPAAGADVSPPQLLTAIDDRPLKGTLADYCSIVGDLPSRSTVETELRPMRLTDPKDPTSYALVDGAEPRKLVLALK